MELPVFKIRCSAMSDIMGAMSGGLPDGQKKELNRLVKLKADKGKITVKQQATVDEYTKKEKEPKRLPKTCITYLEKWMRGKLFKWRKELNTNGVKKGNICEDEAISMLIKNYNLNYGEKNTEFFENEFICGTPDLIYPDRVWDTKCSETPDTFPIFEDSEMKTYNYNYWAQGQGYMCLTKIHYYSVVYAMCNTPEELLEKEIYYSCGGLSAEDREVKEAEIRANHNFDHVALSDRLKRFDFAYEPEYMKRVYERVELCREYINNNLIPKLNKKGNK